MSSLIFIVILAETKHDITYIIKEESVNGTFIGNIITDSGLNRFVTFSGDIGIQLYENQITGLFRIDGNSGRLEVAGRIDREVICPQRVEIFPTKTFTDHLTNNTDHSPAGCQVDFIAYIPPQYWVNIAVIVEDINDHQPQFQYGDWTKGSSYILNISEGVSIGYEVPIKGATDEDTGINGIQTYSLWGDDMDQSTFVLKYVVPCELNLVVKKKLDFEKKAYYKGQLKACDGGKPAPQCAYQNFSIAVIDINDNQPHFEQILYEVKISEETPIMKTIAVVSATDADSGDFGKISYRFGPTSELNIRNYLGINETTGEIWVKSPLDANVISRLRIPVIAQDGGIIAKTGTTMLQIDIEDVNNHAPWIEVKPINSPVNAEESTDRFVQLWVEENQPIGTHVGIILTGDKDVGANGDVTCELKEENSLFRLRYSNSEQERKMYSLQSQVQFDLESMPSSSPLVLQIVCSDAGNPKLITIQDIQVNVLDINEYPAYFAKLQSNLTVHLPENSPPDSFIVQVKATDHDATSRMKFELLEADRKLFRIDSATGKVYTLEEFDRETADKIHFAVRVKELDALGSRAPRTESEFASITLILDDINDNSPSLRSNRTFKILENSPPYSCILGQLEAFDPDLGENGTVRFIFANDFFDINPISGILHAKTALDREVVSQYQLEVEITDLGHPFKRKSLERITVDVEDVNDNWPTWKTPEKLHPEIDIEILSNISLTGERFNNFDGLHCLGLVNISHRASAQIHIVKLVAIDADTEPNANLSFGIVSGGHYRDGSFTLSKNYSLILSERPQSINTDEHFQINQVTRIVSSTLPGGKCKRKIGLYELILRVSDNGNPPLYSDAVIYIRYEEANELVTSLVTILYRSKYVIFFFAAFLLTCSIVFPAVFYLFRNRRKSQEGCTRGVIYMDDERNGQDRSAEMKNWTKDQVDLMQQPFIGSSNIAKEMSASLIRCSSGDESDDDFRSISNAQYQIFPTIPKISVRHDTYF